MNAFENLLACRGLWQGKYVVQDTMGPIYDESSSTLQVIPIFGGRFLRLDYTWAYKGKPQEGSILVGHIAAEQAITAHWIDSWHMSDKVMACRGAVDDVVISVLGHYAAPPGPDWGWRTVITPRESSLKLVMHNITPKGEESLAVDANYVRS